MQINIQIPKKTIIRELFTFIASGELHPCDYFDCDMCPYLRLLEESAWIEGKTNKACTYVSPITELSRLNKEKRKEKDKR